MEIVCHYNCPPLPRVVGIDPVTFGRGVSLPGAPVVLLICSAKWDYSHDGHDYFHDPVWRGVGFVLVGAGVWFLLGGFLDEVIVWRGTRIPPSFRFSNLIFGLTIASVATMSVVGIFDGYALRFPGFAWLVSWSVVWILIGYSCVAICIFQLIQTKKQSARV